MRNILIGENRMRGLDRVYDIVNKMHDFEEQLNEFEKRIERIEKLLKPSKYIKENND